MKAPSLLTRILSKNTNTYFGPFKRTTVEGQSPEEFTFANESHRTAGRLEVTHLACVAAGDWQRFWNGEFGSTLKEPSMNATFFHLFALVTSRVGSITVLMYALTCLPFDYDLSWSLWVQAVG